MTARASKHSGQSSKNAHNCPVKKSSKKSSCLKCGLGGDVLVCSDGDCPIVVHECCMSCDARFDDEGNFYCPYCSYKKSLLECRQAKYKAMLAKEALSSFLGMNTTRNTENLHISESLKRKTPDLPTISAVKDDGNLRIGEGKPQETPVNLARKDNITEIREESNKGNENHYRRMIEEVQVKSSKHAFDLISKESASVTHEKSGNSSKKHQETSNSVEKPEESSDCFTRKDNEIEMHEEYDKGKDSTFQGDYFVRSQMAMKSDNACQSVEIGDYRRGLKNEGKTQVKLPENADQSAEIGEDHCKSSDKNKTQRVPERVPPPMKDSVLVIEEKEKTSEGCFDGQEKEQRQSGLLETSVCLKMKENTTDVLEECEKGNDSIIHDAYSVRSQMTADSENGDQPVEIGEDHCGRVEEGNRRVKSPKTAVHSTWMDSVSVTHEKSDIGGNNASSQSSYCTERGNHAKQKSQMREKLKNSDQSWELSEIELKDVDSGEVTYGKSRQKLNTRKRIQHPALANARRRKLLWTAEEVEMLKEGVQKFSLTANKNVPWMKILEFGRHIFDGTRTPIDLKDKWRNIMGKGQPNPGLK